MLSLNDSVSKLHLVGPQAAAALENLGIKTIGDILFHFPRDWQDLSDIKPISRAAPGEKINIKARIIKIGDKKTRWGRMHILEALLEDETGDIAAIWFNQPFLKNSLFEGREYFFSGKVQMRASLQLSSPTFELIEEQTINTAGIIPL